MSESRKESRLRTFLKGRIVFNGGNSSMDCLVRDLSPSGARLMLSQTATLPDGFDLIIPAKDRVHKASLRWRRDDGVGVVFVEEETRTATPEPALSVAALRQRVSALEAENATLRRLLAEAEVAALARTS
ncbi:PilZ domain-containing protein [Methylobacterium crusticola]|nr:PilZ domain-containing protein [Methylobacterium crusticola]